MKKILLFTLIAAYGPISYAQTWSACGGTALKISEFYRAGSNLLCARPYGDPIMKSTDDGATFDTITTEPAANLYTCALIADGTGVYSIGKSTYFSTDNGENWTYKGSVAPATANDAVFYHSNMYAATNLGVQKSSDGGVTYSSVGSGFTSNNISDIMVANDALYIATLHSGAYKSTDGSTFNSVKGDLPTSSLPYNTIVAIGSTLFYTEYGTGLFTSTNDGTNWTQITTIPSVDITCSYVYGSTLLLGAATGKVFYSTDNGASFTSTTDIPSSVANVLKLYYSDGYLYAGTDNSGAYRTSMSLSTTKVQDVAAGEYKLYPNPNNGIFTLSTGETGNGNVQVTNVLGETVFAGSIIGKECAIDISRAPAGCYILKINSETAAKTMNFFKQ